MIGRKAFIVWTAALGLIAAGCTVQGDHPLYVEVDAGGCGTVEPVPQELAELFSNTCGGGGCHTEGGSAGGLKLDADVAAQNLVGITAQGTASALLVVPGDPDASYLVQKVRGEAAPLMPLGASSPVSETVTAIETWVSSLPPCDIPTPTTPDVVEPTDEGPPPDDGPPPVQNDKVPEAVADFFTTKCAGCHTGGASLGGLNLDPDVAADNLVNVTGNNGTPRVIPQDPDGSLLIQRMNGSVLPLMPQGAQEPLDTEELQPVLDWINGLSTDTPVPDVVEDTKPVTIECTPANETYQVTYGAIISKIKDSCSSNGCHTGGSQAGGLALDDEVFIQNTVGVKAKGNADLYLIHPGEPEQSFLLQRLQGAEGTGSQMPLGGTPFNDEELELFVNWIDDCASSKAEKGVPTTP